MGGLSAPARPFETLPIDSDVRWWAPLVQLRPDIRTSVPELGEPWKVAFVGQRTYFDICSQRGPSPAILPCFIDFREEAPIAPMLESLAAFNPHVVVVFRPEIIPAGVFHGLDALTLGYLTEPLPRSSGSDHDDLERRLHDLALVDESQFDRVIAFDPHIVETAQRYLSVWRAEPLPVADELYCDTIVPMRKASALFVGRSTPHRNAWLLGPKHLFDIMHVEHGVFGEDLAELAGNFLIAINVHNEPYPSFENRVALHLAVGNLVISEPLSPNNGLDPGLDYFEVRTPDELVSQLGLIFDDPSGFDWMRARGRRKAEAFRSSRVYSRLLIDLLLDVAEFGDRCT